MTRTRPPRGCCAVLQEGIPWRMRARGFSFRAGSRQTFEAYCKERWGWGRAHAYRLIDSAKVAEALSPTGDTPSNERQARELAPLMDEPRRVLRQHDTPAAPVGLGVELHEAAAPDVAAVQPRRSPL